MTVLVISQELDPTADEVVVALGERGVPVFRIDRSWFPQQLTLQATFRVGRWRGSLSTAHRRVDLTDIRSVWYRWRSRFSLSPRLLSALAQHADSEARSGFDGVISALPARHVNHPYRVAALSKPNEIALAQRCGLTIPATIVSNSPAHVRAFCTESGAVVRKLFSCSVADRAGPAMVGHTRLVTEEDVAEVDLVALTAHHVQRYVDKAMDVRVAVVGDELFPVAIHPLSPAARVDFRSDYRALRHEVIELPGTVETGIRRFMREGELHLASFDFCVDRDGTYYFLESNPAGGQYGWLQAATGLPISAAVADLLAAQDRP